MTNRPVNDINFEDLATSLTWLGRMTDSPTEKDWGVLTSIYGPLIRRWLDRIRIPESDREDLLQEVLIVAMRRISEFEHRHAGAFRGWLRIILANLLKQYYRERPPEIASPFPLDQLLDPHSDISVQLEREHDDYMIRRVLLSVQSQFTPTNWLAFQAYVVEGRAAQEVADELGITVNAVFKTKARVLKRIRESCALASWEFE